MGPQLILKLSNISKTFPGVQALKNVDMDASYGEVHCLVGENGSESLLNPHYLRC